MKNKIYFISFLLIIVSLYSCSPKNITTKYYVQNKSTLDKIEQSYKELYQQKKFRVAFTDLNFSIISLEIITDTLNYIYEFNLEETRLNDSLTKYGFNANAVTGLINQMHSIRCTWVNHFDYYVDGNKKSLVFLSIKPVGLNGFFSGRKYYILTYFTQKQYYDSEGRLVNNRRQKQLQHVNGEIFKRINNNVCYTVSSRYR